MGAALLLLLKEYWKPVALGVLALGLWGVWTYRGHEVIKYREQVAELKVQLAAEKDKNAELIAQWRADAKKWEDEVKKIKDLLKQAEAEKQEIVDRNLKDFFEQKKQLEKRKQTNENQIQASFKPTDTISVPVDFVRLYQGAVAEGADLPGGTGEQVQVPKDTEGSVGKSETFDATTFTKVVVGNVYEYNDLAIRCNKLIDVVEQLEATYGRTDNGGASGQTTELGRDISDGETGPDVVGYSGQIYGFD